MIGEATNPGECQKKEISKKKEGNLEGQEGKKFYQERFWGKKSVDGGIECKGKGGKGTCKKKRRP